MGDEGKNKELSADELTDVNGGFLFEKGSKFAGMGFLENLAREHDNENDFVKTVGSRVKQVSQLTDEELKRLYNMVHERSE